MISLLLALCSACGLLGSSTTPVQGSAQPTQTTTPATQADTGGGDADGVGSP